MKFDCNELHAAVDANDKEQVERLLVLGGKANVKLASNELINQIIQIGDKVGRAIESGKKGDSKILRMFSRSGSPIFHFAPVSCRKWQPQKPGDPSPFVEMMRLLLQYGVDTNCGQAKMDGMTALHQVCRRTENAIFTEFARLLLEIGQSDPNLVDFEGRTALFYAIELENLSCAKVLLEHGADPTISTFVGWTLLDESLSPTARNESSSPKDAESNSSKDVAVLRLLLEHGGNSNHRDRKHGRPLLHRAVLTDNPKAVEALLEHGADLKAADRDGKTPFEVACAKGRVGCIFHMLQYMVGEGWISLKNRDTQSHNSNSHHETCTTLITASTNGKEKYKTFGARHGDKITPIHPDWLIYYDGSAAATPGSWSSLSHSNKRKKKNKTLFVLGNHHHHATTLVDDTASTHGKEKSNTYGEHGGKITPPHPVNLDWLIYYDGSAATATQGTWRSQSHSNNCKESNRHHHHATALVDDTASTRHDKEKYKAYGARHGSKITPLHPVNLDWLIYYDGSAATTTQGSWCS